MRIKVKTIVSNKRRRGFTTVRNSVGKRNSVETMETSYWVHIAHTVEKSEDKKDGNDPLCTGCPKKVLDRISNTDSHVDFYHPTKIAFEIVPLICWSNFKQKQGQPMNLPLLSAQPFPRAISTSIRNFFWDTL